MEKMLTITQSDAEQLRITLSDCIAEIDRLREIMKEDDIRIAQTQSRTRILMTQIDEMMKPQAQKAA